MKLIKNLTLALLLLTLFSCSKRGCPQPEAGSEQSVIAKSDENYNVSVSYIDSHSWKIVANYSGPTLIWKLQSVDNQLRLENNFIIVDPAPANYFWKEGYWVGGIIDGKWVSTLSIRKAK